MVKMSLETMKRVHFHSDNEGYTGEITLIENPEHEWELIREDKKKDIDKKVKQLLEEASERILKEVYKDVLGGIK